MFYLISKPQNQWKIKCFVRHYSTTILMTPKKKTIISQSGLKILRIGLGHNIGVLD